MSLIKIIKMFKKSKTTIQIASCKIFTQLFIKHIVSIAPRNIQFEQKYLIANEFVKNCLHLIFLKGENIENNRIIFKIKIKSSSEPTLKKVHIEMKDTL